MYRATLLLVGRGRAGKGSTRPNLSDSDSDWRLNRPVAPDTLASKLRTLTKITTTVSSSTAPVTFLRVAATLIDYQVEMDKSMQWTCGKDGSLECRRHINSGAFGDVYEVIAQRCSLTSFRSATRRKLCWDTLPPTPESPLPEK